MSGGFLLFSIAVIAIFVVVMLSIANPQGHKADQCRAAGGVLIKTSDFDDGSVCARITVIQP